MHADDAAPESSALRSTAPNEPDWVRHAIAWHVFPLGAVGAPALCPEGDPDDPSSPAGAMAAEHRLRRLLPWLDRLVELGCNVLMLGPVFHSMSHGYDTIDHMRLDPRLGTNEDLLALIDAAHVRGVRVMLDGVFNHVGIDHPAFAALPEAGPHSREASMFHLTWPGGDGAGGETGGEAGGTGETGETWAPGIAPDYRRFEGQDWLPELNHSCEAVVDLVADVMTHWCERGVDGWRLDAAYAVDPAFWTRVLPRVRRDHPQVYIVGEVIHGDYAAIVTASGMNSVTQYELWQAIWHSLAEANFYELDWTLRRNADLLATFVPWTFIGNHDTSRIASQLPDARRLPHALALLMTLPGTPAIYYGDEDGLRAIKEDRLGGDDAIRPELPASPHERDGGSVRPLHQELIGVRRRLPWLHDAEVDALHLDNTVLSLRMRAHSPEHESAESTERAEAVLVLSLEETEAWLPTAGHQVVLASTYDAPPPRPEGDGVVLPPLGWAVLT